MAVVFSLRYPISIRHLRYQKEPSSDITTTRAGLHMKLLWSIPLLYNTVISLDIFLSFTSIGLITTYMTLDSSTGLWSRASSVQ